MLGVFENAALKRNSSTRHRNENLRRLTMPHGSKPVAEPANFRGVAKQRTPIPLPRLPIGGKHGDTLGALIEEVPVEEIGGGEGVLNLRTQRNRHKPIARNFMASGQEHRVLRGPGVGLDPKAGAQNREAEHDQGNVNSPPDTLARRITMLERCHSGGLSA